jgi:hypothetical protein
VVLEPLANVPDAPLPGAANVTVVPGTGLPAASITSATNGLGNALPTVADCPEPDTTETEDGAPGALVRLKLAPLAPVADALTDYPPALLLAVNVLAVACPSLPVVAVVVAVPLTNVPEAPLPGALKVTLTPGTGLPAESVTCATNAPANALPTVADCPDPDTTATEDGAPAVLLRPKLAVLAPLALALTEEAPATLSAVKALEAACPSLPVVAVAVAEPLANVPDAPLPGALNVTLTPETGLPAESFTLPPPTDSRTHCQRLPTGRNPTPPTPTRTRRPNWSGQSSPG